MLSLEHDMWPALYLPNRERDTQLPPARPTIRNHALSSVSVGTLCRAMSIETNNHVDWFMQWWDYGDVDAFFSQPRVSSNRRDTLAPSPGLISGEQLVSCLELHGLLGEVHKVGPLHCQVAPVETSTCKRGAAGGTENRVGVGFVER